MKVQLKPKYGLFTAYLGRACCGGGRASTGSAIQITGQIEGLSSLEGKKITAPGDLLVDFRAEVLRSPFWDLGFREGMCAIVLGTFGQNP